MLLNRIVKCRVDIGHAKLTNQPPSPPSPARLNTQGVALGNMPKYHLLECRRVHSYDTVLCANSVDEYSVFCRHYEETF